MESEITYNKEDDKRKYAKHNTTNMIHDSLGNS